VVTTLGRGVRFSRATRLGRGARAFGRSGDSVAMCRLLPYCSYLQAGWGQSMRIDSRRSGLVSQAPAESRLSLFDGLRSASQNTLRLGYGQAQATAQSWC